MLTIGIANFNNGHYLDRVHSQDMPEIYVAYALRPFEKPLQVKIDGGLSRDPKKRDRFLRNAKPFMERQNRFWWDVLDGTSGKACFEDRIEMISQLAVKAVTEFDERDTFGYQVVVNGHVFGDGEGNSFESLNAIPKRMSELGLDANLEFSAGKKFVDNKDYAVHVARNLAYCLGSMKFGSKRQLWPAKDRKIGRYDDSLNLDEIALIESMLETGYRATG